MKALILGADGQLGLELMGALACFARVDGATEADFDMTDDAALARAVDLAAPDVIVNAAAYTDVDGAERNPEAAMRVNANAVASLGALAAARRCALVHYSTDFVFDGRKPTAYVESDAPGPLNEYGRSKLAGERALLEADAPALIFRTAWVYSLRRKSFVSSILRLAREREQLRVVDDQVGNPTFCRDLAQATALLLFDMRQAPYARARQARGVYHLAGTGACSRYELAKAIVELDPMAQQHKVRSIEPVPTSAYPLPADRPATAALDCSLAHERFGVQLPPWRESLARALQG